jgi:hypothetical protein
MAVLRICVEEKIPKLFDISGDSILKELLLRNFHKSRLVNRSFIFDRNLAFLQRRGKRLKETTIIIVTGFKNRPNCPPNQNLMQTDGRTL